MTPSSQLVIGCSEQLPHELRAYRLMGVSSDGALLLSCHGATYSARQGEVSDYGVLLERMLGSVLGQLPLRSRASARAILTRRWNRDWGVEAEDVIQAEAVDAAATWPQARRGRVLRPTRSKLPRRHSGLRHSRSRVIDSSRLRVAFAAADRLNPP